MMISTLLVYLSHFFFLLSEVALLTDDEASASLEANFPCLDPLI